MVTNVFKPKHLTIIHLYTDVYVYLNTYKWFAHPWKPCVGTFHYH